MTEPTTVQQYRDTDPLHLPQSAIDTLITTYRTQVEVRPAADGAVILRGLNYVGLIRTPELDVLVTPKVGTLSVFWMLGYAHRLVSFDRELVHYGAETGLLDLLARLFAEHTETVIRRGLYRAYVEREDNLRFVRGRILPFDDLRANLGLHHQVVCRFGELTADVPHNRILRAVIEQLLRYEFRLPGIRERLAWDAANLAEVSRVSVSERDFATLRYGRLNAHYRDVHALARLILRHQVFTFASGQHEAPAFLVDMDKVFEEYLTRLIEEQARPLGLRLASTRGLTLDVGRLVFSELNLFITKLFSTISKTILYPNLFA